VSAIEEQTCREFKIPCSSFDSVARLQTLKILRTSRRNGEVFLNEVARYGLEETFPRLAIRWPVPQPLHGARLAICSVFPSESFPSLFPLFLFLLEALTVGHPAECEPTTPWSQNNKAWRRARRARGIPDLHTHDMRYPDGMWLRKF
jgi:hypothetical protein